MGHSPQHDLKALRMIYSRIVDTAVLTVRGRIGSAQPHGLKRLAQDLPRIQIRTGKGVHDCVEDVLVTREVVTVFVRPGWALFVGGGKYPVLMTPIADGSLEFRTWRNLYRCAGFHAGMKRMLGAGDQSRGIWGHPIFFSSFTMG